MVGVCLIAAIALTIREAGNPPVDGSPQSSASTRSLRGKDVAAELRRRIESAAPADFPQLMRLALQSGPPDAQRELIAELMRRWLTLDVRGFARWLDEMEVEGGAIWGRLAPGMMAAMSQLDSEIANTFLIRDVVERVILKVAMVDPHKALAWANEWLAGKHLDSALTGIAIQMANVDPDAAIQLVPKITALAKRMEAAIGVGRVLGAADSERGLAWAGSFLLETERAFALSGVLSGMAGRDWNGAAEEYLRTVEAMKSRFRESVLADRAVAGTTAEEEYEGLTRAEIEKAELAKPNPNLIYFEKAAYAIGLAMARESPENASEWARSLDIYQGRGAALEAVFEQWASSDPAAAFESYLLEPDRRPELAERMFGTWAESDPQSAAMAALGMAVGAERIHVVEGVARGWLESGAAPSELVSWAKTLRVSAEQDAVRAIVASETGYDRPVYAWSQVEQIRDAVRRARVFGEIFPSLAANNPQVARQALASAGLSAVETEYYEHMLGK